MDAAAAVLFRCRCCALQEKEMKQDEWDPSFKESMWASMAPGSYRLLHEEVRVRSHLTAPYRGVATRALLLHVGKTI